jgi:ferredoxin
LPGTSWKSGPEQRRDPIRAHYGYSDALGEFYITIDTDRCNGCGDCVTACPYGLLAVFPDDYDEPKAVIKAELAKKLSDLCPGYYTKCTETEPNCHTACPAGAIEHSW